MAGYFEVKKAANGEWMFLLKAGNHETVLTSETYKRRASCEGGIESVRRNAPIEERYERTETASGAFRFHLRATNGQTIGVSQNYSSAAARDKGIEAVKHAVVNAAVKEVAPPAPKAEPEARPEAEAPTEAGAPEA